MNHPSHVLIYGIQYKKSPTEETNRSSRDSQKRAEEEAGRLVAETFGAVDGAVVKGAADEGRSAGEVHGRRRVGILERLLGMEESALEEDDVEIAETLLELSSAYSDLGDAEKQKEQGPLQPLVDMVPDNVIGAATGNGNMLKVIFFVIFFGVGSVGG